MTHTKAIFTGSSICLFLVLLAISSIGATATVGLPKLTPTPTPVEPEAVGQAIGVKKHRQLIASRTAKRRLAWERDVTRDWTLWANLDAAKVYDTNSATNEGSYTRVVGKVGSHGGNPADNCEWYNFLGMGPYNSCGSPAHCEGTYNSGKQFCACSSGLHGLYTSAKGYQCCKSDGTSDGGEQCCDKNVNIGNVDTTGGYAQTGCNFMDPCCDMKNGYLMAYNGQTQKYGLNLNRRRGTGVAKQCKNHYLPPTCTTCENGYYDVGGTNCVRKKVDGESCDMDNWCQSENCQGGHCCNSNQASSSGTVCEKCNTDGGTCLQCTFEDYGIKNSAICNKCDDEHYFTTDTELSGNTLPTDGQSYCAKLKDDGAQCNSDKMCKSGTGRCKDFCCNVGVPVDDPSVSRCLTCNSQGSCESCDKNGKGPYCRDCQDGYYKDGNVCRPVKNPGESCVVSKECKPDVGTCDRPKLFNDLAIKQKTNRRLNTPAPAVTLRKLTTSTMTTSKCPNPITVKAECDAAAQSAGKVGSTAEDETDFPKGCYQWRGDGFYFNSGDGTPGSDCSTTNVCFCKSETRASCASFGCPKAGSDDYWVHKNNIAGLSCASSPCTEANDKTTCCKKLSLADAVVDRDQSVFLAADAQCNDFYLRLMSPMMESLSPATETMATSFQTSMCNAGSAFPTGTPSCIDRFVQYSADVGLCFTSPKLQAAFDRISQECDLASTSYPQVSARVTEGFCKGSFCCSSSAVLQSNCNGCSSGNGQCTTCGSDGLANAQGTCPTSCPSGSTTKIVYKKSAPVGKDCESVTLTRICNRQDGTWGDYTSPDNTLVSSLFDTCKNGCKTVTGRAVAHGSYLEKTRYKDMEVKPNEACQSQSLRQLCTDGNFGNLKDVNNADNSIIFEQKSCARRCSDKCTFAMLNNNNCDKDW